MMRVLKNINIMEIDYVSTKELFELLNDPAHVVLDFRPTAAFNGWKLKDEARGGHLPGANSFPSEWIHQLESHQLTAILQSKNLTSQNTIILYGYEDDEFIALANFLVKAGIQKIKIYEAGFQEWANHSNLPIETLANYQQLVYPEWIKKLQSGENPEHRPCQDFGLYEICWGGYENYRAGHIPGAIFLDLSTIEDPETWNIVPDRELFDQLSEWGISSNMMCVLYSRDVMAAARAALILMYSVVMDVRLLDGGFESWIHSGYEIETHVNPPHPKESFGKEKPAHPEYLLGINDVKSFLIERKGLLVSVRSWEEYIGAARPYSYIQPVGRIAGALWGYSGSGPDQMQDFRNPDHSMRPSPEIETNWHKRGITKEKKIIFYCATGWRASEAFWYAYLMGWPNIAIYDGGWFEWSKDPSNPIELGIPET